MAKTAGFTVKSYRYYDAATKSINFEGLKQDLEVSELAVCVNIMNSFTDFKRRSKN